jgi:hypothetical protein
MAITEKKLEQLNNKFKNLNIRALEVNDGKVDVFDITYQQNGLPGKISEGLREANAMWDERQSRPPGYIVAHAFEVGDGVAISVMVTEEWLDGHKLSESRKKWEANV